MPYTHEDGRLRPDLRLGESDPSVRKVATVVLWFQHMAGLPVLWKFETLVLTFYLHESEIGYTCLWKQSVSFPRFGGSHLCSNLSFLICACSSAKFRWLLASILYKSVLSLSIRPAAQFKWNYLKRVLPWTRICNIIVFIHTILAVHYDWTHQYLFISSLVYFLSRYSRQTNNQLQPFAKWSR